MATFPIARQETGQESLGWKAVSVGERAGALLLLAVTAPAHVAIAATLATLSRRSPLIAHRRVGLNGSELWVLKLRTMWDDAPGSFRWVEYVDDSEPAEGKCPEDARVRSRFARFCRRHSLDELPQLWQVVRGEMALIGPRPLTRLEIRKHYADSARELLSLKPGLAGLWQTSGRNRLSYAERRELDLYFVRKRSARMYLSILARVLPEIVSGANAW